MASNGWDVIIPFQLRASAEACAAKIRDKWACLVQPSPLTPSADLPACRDEDPATPAILAAAYPPEYQHPEDDNG